MGVSLFTSKVFVDNLLDVSDCSLRPDLLESIFKDERPLHFLIHLHFIVLAPHLLDHEVLS